MSNAQTNPSPGTSGYKENSRSVINSALSPELFFALVGPVGSGCTHVAGIMRKALESKGYKVFDVRAGEIIRDWASQRSIPSPPSSQPGEGRRLEDQGAMQDLGDQMRTEHADNAAAAIGAINVIRMRRAESRGISAAEGEAVDPDGTQRAYIIDSLKQPAEVELLRAVYRNAFALIGVVCEREVRKKRLFKIFLKGIEESNPKKQEAVESFMDRDSLDPSTDHGQKVVDTFHQADFFVDNSKDDGSQGSPQVNDQISRLIELLTHSGVQRPTLEEAAMHAAASAQRASACLSRQVGAALVDRQGNIVSTGSNEVPRAGGGIYARPLRFGDDDGSSDFRCAFHPSGQYCRSTRTQNEMVSEVTGLLKSYLSEGDFPTHFKAELLAEMHEVDSEKIIKSLVKCLDEPSLKKKYQGRLKRTRIGSLIEFSRAVHAEMDAILSAARAGATIVGSRLFVTTFPCHYCARHIVTAGVHEVQFIEPYPKSLALTLHADSVQTSTEVTARPLLADLRWTGGEVNDASRKVRLDAKVVFRPFVGVAPRLYERAFTKDREYKDKESGEKLIGTAPWGSPSSMSRVPYAQLEASVVKPALGI